MHHVPMKHRRTTLERAEKFISTRYFADVNLTSRLYPDKHDVTSLSHWSAPKGTYTPFESAVKQKYTPAKVGDTYGPTWSTHWFKIEIDIPEKWVGKEVRLRWNSGSEALVWNDGHPVQGLCSEYDRLDYTLSECLEKTQLHHVLYIEMACNGMFGAGVDSMIAPPNPDKQFTIACCKIAVFDRKVYNLWRDIELLYSMAKDLPEGDDHAYQALYTVNDMINACDVTNTDSFQSYKTRIYMGSCLILIVSRPNCEAKHQTHFKCHEIAQKFFNQKNGDSQHTTYAMGHAHIDTAWLWPYSETKRKCARSWSCSLRLMEKFPDYQFTCSQAQQYEWLKQQYPSLYGEVKKYVKLGQFIPVGGTWVEMDGLIPSGEAFVRQFLYGQRFFQKEFGFTCKEFWLPDTFGYSGQLPQILYHCGIKRFLTQKMSWSLVNKFPNHSFWWEGIDGSRVLTHFPPADTYGGDGTVSQLLKSKTNFLEKGRSDKTIYLFGFGDGGNGPSEDMLERLKRSQDVDGLPKVKLSNPDEFFSKVETEDGHKLCTWAGELYLELHNGTYTTHAKVKKMNRRCEFLLHDVEFLWTVAVSDKTSTLEYPQTEIDRLWKLLLLNQFHDVLPGSSIGLVYEDAHRYYSDIVQSSQELLKQASEGVTPSDKSSNEVSHVIWNSQSWGRKEVISVDNGGDDGQSPAKKRLKSDKAEMTSQVDKDGRSLYYVDVPSYGYQVLSPVKVSTPVTASKKDGSIVLENELLKAVIDKVGRVTRLELNGSGRNAISDEYPANQFCIYDDIPLYWDAWDVMDYHLETRKPVIGIVNQPEVVEEGPLRASVKFSLQISPTSKLVQVITLDVGSPYLKFETEVEWNENRKFLKVEFPTSIHSQEATYDIQFGQIKRPNHYNTTWDSARYEVCGLKWSDLSEHGFGVAVLNDCKYGHSAVKNILRMSLLRAPKAPDANADIETHTFTYALMPHRGSLQDSGVIQHAYSINNPLSVFTQKCPKDEHRKSYFSVGNAQVVLETVKKSEDGNDIILRLYESYGGMCETFVETAIPFTDAVECDGLENEKTDKSRCLKVEGNKIYFNIKPFSILALKLKL